VTIGHFKELKNLSPLKTICMILITGATSVIGQELCKLLAKNGKHFRAMCRKAEQLEKFHAQGMEAVLGSFDNIQSMIKAVEHPLDYTQTYRFYAKFLIAFQTYIERHIASGSGKRTCRLY
jgi:NADPH:quinone reductase-like Zn-dependent oxidoreductase